MKRRYVTKRYAPDRTGTAPSRHKRRCTPNQGTPSLFRCHSQMGSRVWGYLGIEASSPILEPVILYMGKLGLFAMYVCTRSVQTYLVKGSRGCNRLLLPWIGCDQFGHKQMKNQTHCSKLDGCRTSRHRYPAGKGAANHRPHHFTEDFLYVRKWENLPFLLCTHVRDSYNSYGKYPPGALLYESKVGVFKLNTPIKSTVWVLNQAAELAVPKVGTAKIR